MMLLGVGRAGVAARNDDGLDPKEQLPMTVEEAANYLLNVADVTLIQLFMLAGPGLLLIAVLSWLSGYVAVLASHAFGRSTYYFLFGWLGTLIHEIAHAVAALLFGHQIASFYGFTLNPNARVQGSVGTRFPAGNLYKYIGMFFIGIAPVVFGPLVIYLALYLLFHSQMPEMWRMIDRRNEISGTTVQSILSSGLAFFGFVFSPQHLLDWRFYLFLYIAFAVGSSIRLSTADIDSAKLGCLPMVALLFMLNMVLLAIGSVNSATFTWLTQYYTFFYILLCFVILLELLVVAILWVPATLRSL
jgi:hypothetical protein